MFLSSSHYNFSSKTVGISKHLSLATLWKEIAQTSQFIIDLSRLKDYCSHLQFPLCWQCMYFLVCVCLGKKEEKDLKKIHRKQNTSLNILKIARGWGWKILLKSSPINKRTRSKAKNLNWSDKSWDMWNVVSVIPHYKLDRAKPWLTLRVPLYSHRPIK